MLSATFGHVPRLVFRMCLVEHGRSCISTTNKVFRFQKISSLTKFKPRLCPERNNPPSNGSSTVQEFQLAVSQQESCVKAPPNIDDLIFDVIKDTEDGKVQVGRLIKEIESTGFKRTDSRLSSMSKAIQDEYEKQHEEGDNHSFKSYINNLRLDRETFRMVVNDSLPLITRAFQEDLVIPDFIHFCSQIDDIFNECRKFRGGKVASYIPQLAQMDPTFWGLSVCTVDGQRFSFGDAQVPYTIQSCSKPFTYALALNELGADTVHKYVGQEPSGRMFNELVLDYNKKPHNPMVNAGAIMVCALLKMLVHPDMTMAEKFDFTHSTFKRLAGRDNVGFNNAVFLSESAAADRNYALAHYMREHKCFPVGCDLKECLDYYFQCCSIEVNCESSAVIAATVANGGVCPITDEKVLKPESVRDVLSLMHSCGMYDYSGQFAFKVGIPAKSGVSGSIILVVPNVMGMAMFSPPLDPLGNSIRGVKFCQELVRNFNFEKYDNWGNLHDKVDPRKHRYEQQSKKIVNLLFMAASGDVTSMRRYYKAGVDMEAVDYDGRTALHLAAAEGHLECVEFLLSKCNVSHQPVDRWGRTPLEDAEYFGHPEVVKLLQTCGHNLD